MAFNINNELNFIHKAFQDLHKIAESHVETKKEAIKPETNDEDVPAILTDANRLTELYEKFEQKNLEWSKNDHPLHAYASSIKEISNSLDQLQKVTKKMESSTQSFFGKLCITIFGNTYKKQEIELHNHLNQQLAKLATDLVKQRSDAIQSTNDTLSHLVTLIDLKNKISTSPLFQTTEKVNCVRTFLHQSGIFRHKTLQQKENLEASANYLKKRVSVLNQRLKITGSLPVHFNAGMNQVERQYRSELRLNESPPSAFTPNEINSIEKEAFHILSDRLSNEEFQGIDITRLEGSGSVKSLMSTSAAIGKHFKDVNHPIAQTLQRAQIVASQLALANAYDTIPHEEYLKYANEYSDNMKLFEQKKADMLSNGTYISDRHVIEKLNPDERRALGNALEKISPHKGLLSKEALASTIVNSIIDQNKALTKQGDSVILNAGSQQHAILFEFKKEEDGTYSAAIFNTGLGANYHITESDEKGIVQTVKPFKISGLKQEDITDYDFISGIVETEMKPATTNEEETGHIRALYIHFQRHLIIKSKGKNVSDSCQSYSLQRRGTCSYSSIEAWLMSHLTEEEMKGYLYTSAEYIVDRLAQAVLNQVDTISAELEEKSLIAKTNAEATKTEKEIKSQAVVQRSAVQTLRLYEEALKMKAELAKYKIDRR